MVPALLDRAATVIGNFTDRNGGRTRYVSLAFSITLLSWYYYYFYGEILRAIYPGDSGLHASTWEIKTNIRKPSGYHLV
jgi:hypothetical protein